MNKNKGRVGFTAGNFDLLHPGYIYTFETAKEHCDYLIIFLQSDPSATRTSKYKPVIPLYERYKTFLLQNKQLNKTQTSLKIKNHESNSYRSRLIR